MSNEPFFFLICHVFFAFSLISFSFSFLFLSFYLFIQFLGSFFYFRFPYVELFFVLGFLPFLQCVSLSLLFFGLFSFTFFFLFLRLSFFLSFLFVFRSFFSYRIISFFLSLPSLAAFFDRPVFDLQVRNHTMRTLTGVPHQSMIMLCTEGKKEWWTMNEGMMRT